jgi:alcohol dehydrogenase class IV
MSIAPIDCSAAQRASSAQVRIVVTVPAFNWLWTSHDELNHHVERYTAKAMRDLMSDAGLTAIETSYLFQSLLLPKLLVRAKEALTAPAARVPQVPSRQ